jgi:hypothetical protein
MSGIAGISMEKTIGIKVVCFSVINNTLSLFAPNGKLPAATWEKGMVLEDTVRALIPFHGYCEQLYTFADKSGFDITIVYYFLTEGDWENHLENQDADIVSYAIQRLRWKIEYTSVVQHLLPKEFTLSELQLVYEAILGKRLDKRNFRKKILSLGILGDTKKKRTLGRARPAEVYTFHLPAS